MTTMTKDPAVHLREQYARGDFAFWADGYEEEWRAESGERPMPPHIQQAIRISVKPNHEIIRHRHDASNFADYDAALECGKGYLVGKAWTMEAFLDTYSIRCDGWKRDTYLWALENPLWCLNLNTPGKDWKICVAGNYVIFRLPHHDAGGEKTWITKDGKTLVQVDDD